MAKLKHFDILNIKHYVIFITFIVLTSCKNAPEHLTEPDWQVKYQLTAVLPLLTVFKNLFNLFMIV